MQLTASEVKEFEAELEELAQPEKEAVMELTISRKGEGRQEGLQQGLQQGRQEGLQQAMASLAIHQIERRFGPLEPEVQERIRSVLLLS